jgi:hypothetical protein
VELAVVVVAVVVVVVVVVDDVAVAVDVVAGVAAVVVAVVADVVEKVPELVVESVEAAATTLVGADVAIVDPFLFVAVTATLRVEPTSPATSTYVGVAAPGTALHAAPELSHRFH